MWDDELDQGETKASMDQYQARIYCQRSIKEAYAALQLPGDEVTSAIEAVGKSETQGIATMGLFRELSSSLVDAMDRGTYLDLLIS